MKTMTTQTIDGFDIIKRIGNVDGLIDPEATKKVVAKKIIDTEIHKQIHVIKKQMQTYAIQALQARKNCKNAKTKDEKKKFLDEYKGREFQINELQKELKPLAVELEKKHKEMIIEHAIYFIPTPGEEIIKDSKAENITKKMIDALQSGKLLDKNLDQIDDYRGKIFWKKVNSKWEKSDINKLGEVPVIGAIEDKNLTDAQRIEISAQMEIDRIAAMKPAEREAEKLAVITGLKSRAAMMKVELDIDGDLKALKKSQDWLKIEIAKVEKKYG